MTGRGQLVEMADVVINVRVGDALDEGKLLGLTQQAIDRALTRAVARILAYGRSITPVSTPAKGWKDTFRYGPRGTLRQSFDVGKTAKMIVMKWDAPYASIADEGAVPHTITGNPLLHFKSRFGTWHLTPSVNHPGYAGHRFSDQMRIVAPQFVREAIIEELQGMNIP